MNRYLLRSLVALSTFLLSIAVSAVIHPFGSRRSEHRYSNFVYSERRCRRAMSSPTASLSIDAIASDPVKLLYSQTVPQPYSSAQQVNLLFDNQTYKGINAVVVGIMVASVFYMMKDISITEFKTLSFMNISVIVGTWALLSYTKLPSPLIVVICLILGWVFNYLATG